MEGFSVFVLVWGGGGCSQFKFKGCNANSSTHFQNNTINIYFFFPSISTDYLERQGTHSFTDYRIEQNICAFRAFDPRGSLSIYCIYIYPPLPIRSNDVTVDYYLATEKLNQVEWKRRLLSGPIRTIRTKVQDHNNRDKQTGSRNNSTNKNIY